MFRVILLCLVLVAVFVLGGLLYSQHVKRSTDLALARQQSAQDTGTTAVGQIDAVPDGERPETTPSPEVPLSVKTDGEMPKGVTENVVEGDANLDSVDIELLGVDPSEETAGDANLDDVAALLSEEETPETEVVEEARVSPFGFGPYPEVPADYPLQPTWEQEAYTTFSQDTQRELELLDRVLIKLWTQGERGYLGGSTSDGKVYPRYKNAAYVRYKRNWGAFGLRYIAEYSGSGDIRITPEQIRSGKLPPHIRLLDKDSHGIDPYEFLGFPTDSSDVNWVKKILRSFQ